MIKFYSIICGALLLASAGGYAQCTPDPNNLALITPDTTTNFVSGTVGVPYSQVVLIHAPTDSNVTLPGLPGPVLVSNVQVELMSFSGLPPGLTNQCNPTNCVFLGGVSGCSEISGLPTTAGTYPLFAIIGASGTIFGGTISVGPIIDTLLAYRIIILPSGVGINQVENGLSFVNVTPSLTNNNVEVQFNTVNTVETFVTISNTIGQAMGSQKIKSKSGINAFNISTAALSNGVYTVSLQTKNQIISRRFVVTR